MFDASSVSLFLVSIFTITLVLCMVCTVAIWLKVKSNHRAFLLLNGFFLFFLSGEIILVQDIHVDPSAVLLTDQLGRKFIIVGGMWALSLLSGIGSLWYFIKTIK